MIANAAGRIQSYRHHEILYLQQMPSVDANARVKCSMLTRMAEQLRRETTMPGSCSSQVAARKGAAIRCLCCRDLTRQQSDINHVLIFFGAESRVDFDQLQSHIDTQEKFTFMPGSAHGAYILRSRMNLMFYSLTVHIFVYITLKLFLQSGRFMFRKRLLRLTVISTGKFLSKFGFI